MEMGRRGLAAALVLALAIVLFAALMLNDALAVRSELNEARSATEAATSALADGDVVGATARVEEADQLVQAANRRTARPWWRLAAAVPLGGRSFVIASSVTDLAVEAVALAREGIEHAAPLFGAGGDPAFEVSDGAIDLAPFEDVRRRMERVKTPGFARAVDRLAAVETTWVPEEVRAGQRDALRMGNRLLRTVEVGQSLVEILPAFLGADGPRHYFLAMQNPAELRGTGGFIGLWAVLTVDRGRFDLAEPEVLGTFDRPEEVPVSDLSPVETSAEFAQRYGRAGGNSTLKSVNLDPDLPTVGPVLLDLAEQRINEDLDGVILLDPLGLAELLEVVGPIEVVNDVGLDGLPAVVQPDELPNLTMVELYYEAEKDESGQRKAYLGLVAEAAFAAVLDGGWDPVLMADRLGAIAGRRNLQLYSRHTAEQEAFEQAGVSGSLRAGAPEADLIAFTGINSAPNKADVHVAHRSSIQIALRRAGERRARATFEIENPLPDDGPPVVVGGVVSSPGGRLGPERARGAISRTWTTVWTPADTTVISARSDDGNEILRGTDRIHGHRAFDHFLEVPSKSTGSFEVEYRGPVELVADGPDLVYRLTLWRQAKAIPDHIDLAVEVPEGWTVAEARLEGGGDGKGMGVGGDGTPLQIEHDGTTVRVQGAMTRDAHVEVRFTRGLWNRFEEWLRQPAF